MRRLLASGTLRRMLTLVATITIADIAGAMMITTVPAHWPASARLAAVAIIFGLCILVIAWDIARNFETEARDQETIAQKKLHFMASHDALTLLPNRVLTIDRIQYAIAAADRNGTKVAVMALDLDGFKSINDSLGHSIGDALLRDVAVRLRECVRESDTITRLGGDEFLVVLPDARDSEAMTAVAEKVMECLAAPFELGGSQIPISASIGIAIYPEDGADFETLLKNADTAMYHAKEAGRNTYHFFDEVMNTNATEYLRLRNALHQALQQGQLSLCYQPQLDLTTNEVSGAEALIRWTHPDLGSIPPSRFIPVAEDTGVIVQIGEWVLREACRQARVWHDSGFGNLTIAVNLSAMQFKRGNLERTVADALEESQLRPECLELELTESMLIRDTESVLETVNRLRDLGIKLSIDDFGTGYSSLAYLKRFNVHKLKIDRSFVTDLIGNQDDAAIIRAIIQMARGLNLRTIAEGVEDQNILDVLRIYHCDEAQGFHIARPLTASAFSDFLQKTNAKLAQAA